MTRFYCTNSHCGNRTVCKHACQQLTSDKLLIHGQGMSYAPCPDFVSTKPKLLIDVVLSASGGIY